MLINLCNKLKKAYINIINSYIINKHILENEWLNYFPRCIINKYQRSVNYNVKAEYSNNEIHANMKRCQSGMNFLTSNFYIQQCHKERNINKKQNIGLHIFLRGVIM